MSTKLKIEDSDALAEEVWLGDDGPFDFYPPKIGKLMKTFRRIGTSNESESGGLMLQAQWDWLERGFGEEDWEHIEARLDDDDDPLDFPHIQKLFEDLLAVAAGRPTISPGASSPKRQAKRRQAARSVTASDSETSE